MGILGAGVVALRPLVAAMLEWLSLTLRGVGLTESSRLLAGVDLATASVVIFAGGVVAAVLGSLLATYRPALTNVLSRSVFWAPRRTWDAVLAFALVSILVLLADGWAFLPSLGNDVTAYHAEIWRDLEAASSISDVLRPRSGLPGLTVLYATLGSLLGYEWTALLLTFLGLTGVLTGLWRILYATGCSPRVAALLPPVSLALDYGAKKSQFDTLIVNHGGSLVPSPRSLGVAVLIIAIALLLSGRTIAATGVTVFAASLHALDGLIPMVLLVTGGLVTHVVSRWRVRSLAGHRAGLALLLLALVLLPFVRNYEWIPFLEGGQPDPATALVLIPSTVLLILLGTVAIAAQGPSGLVERVRPLSFMLLALVPAGLVFALLRSPSRGASDAGFMDSIILYESLIESVRRPQAVLLSVQQAGTAAMLVVLAAFALAALTTAGAGSLSGVTGSNARWLAAGGLAVLTFAVVGGVFNEFTSLPLVTSVYPFRHLWLLAVAALAGLGRVLSRLERSTTMMPGLPVGGAVALALLGSDLDIGNTLIGLGVVALVLLNVDRLTEMLSRSLQGMRSSSTINRLHDVVRGGAPLLLLALCAVLVVGPLSAASLPTVGIEANLERIAQEGGDTDRDIISSARAAGVLVDEGAIILVPFRPSGWTAFKLVSGRPIAFDYNAFGGTAEWYSGFRWMCDPTYDFDPKDNFSAVRVPDVIACMEEQGPDEILAVARRFGVRYGDVPAAQWDGSGVLFRTDGGRFVLVDFDGN